jgi:hypothetical protein
VISELCCRMASFGVPKQGSEDTEWEDAAAHSERSARFALADGAAAAYGAGLWSHILASGFVNDPFAVQDRDAFEGWLSLRAQAWVEATAPGDGAPYYIRHAVDRGSFATFLAVELDRSAGFRAMAVGDSCLFVVRGRELREAFPIADPEEFGYHPALVGTESDRKISVRTASGSLESGDILVAATDAMSEWLLRAHAKREAAPLNAILDATDSIDALVQGGRSSGALRNDDVAVIRCVVGGGAHD